MYKKDKLRDYIIKEASAATQSHIARDVKMAQAKNNDSLSHNFSQDDFQEGILWFDSGNSLENAPEKMRQRVSFVNGFKKAQRLKIINEQLYALGKEYCLKGMAFDKVPDNYKKNEYFIAGYENTMKKERHK